MSASSRDSILQKLRSARRPFAAAPPRPAAYLPVTTQEDASALALTTRFVEELERLSGEAFIADTEDAARERVISLLSDAGIDCVIAWELAHLPVRGMAQALADASIAVLHPEARDEFRAETLATAERAAASLTGVDAAAATTGTLIVTAGAGKGRLPTVLAPFHIAVLRADQIVATIEAWVAQQRAAGLGDIRAAANVCFISGPSRTGDIEMELILGVHGPGRLAVVIIR